ncbi:factor associated with metabolism and energy-like isoform X2 [Scyliorhinus torazame]|uniref:factor associated with metabolism and energy-like isoform X2 n=1 Tax=Scyliorhinus torazame TaxID=75743 RepID=UPI003B5900B5
MGSGWSKVHHKVVKVTPVPGAGADTCPRVERDRSPGAQSGLVAAGERLTRGHPKAAFRPRIGELPPLKVAGFGTRALSALKPVPRPISIDAPLDMGDRSIIKNHPPRRFEAQEIQEEIAKQFSRRRQKIHKIQYVKKQKQKEAIHLQEQTELKRCLQLETHNNKQKIKDHRAKKAREKEQTNNHQEDQYYIALEDDGTFNTNDDNPWNELISPMLFINNNNHFRIPQQLVKHQTPWNDSSNSFSNESLDCWMNDNRQSQHRLMRTKTERILVFDEFFDQEL